MAEPHEAPALTVPREDIFKAAISLRLMAGSLSRIRARHGRAAFDDSESAARKAEASRLNALHWFTRRDVEDWSRATETGRVFADRDPDSGMTVLVAPLGAGRFGVQAGWPDHHADVVTGSAEAAQDLHRWLREQPTPERIAGLRDWITSRHAEAQRGADVEQARTWAAEHNPDWYRSWQVAHAMSGAATQVRAEGVLVDRMNAHRAAEREQDAAEGGHALIAAADRDWADFVSELADNGAAVQEAWVQPFGDDVSLADRLRGRVPDTILDNPRWPTVETRFRELVDAGADPTRLAGAVRELDWTEARSPSGYAIWALDDTDTRARAERRELAAEWLLNTDPDDPRDRAEASDMLGRIDDAFDAQLGQRFPGLLDPTATMLERRAAAELADAQSDETLAAHLGAEPDHTDTIASLAQRAMSWHSTDDVDEEPIANLWSELSVFAYPDDQQPDDQLQADAVDDRAHVDQDQAQADSIDADILAAAQAPLTPPRTGNTRSNIRRTPRKAATPAAQRNHNLHRGRGL
ncbi:hypothetical protein MPY17_40165 (plasmid) [Rhodococcus opacus]|uniref:hypothetical protein n=1 Tax=Rhodococcus opacus TaxID=37919 RepID=UPI001FF6C733|nr:hypothetical protein [Rhodococcus opacus]UOT08476.1 hypothetical protein MPY17_40165 [Rhodococcus opacus]